MPLFKIVRHYKALDARAATADIYVDAVDAAAAMAFLLAHDPDVSDLRFENVLEPAVEVAVVGQAVKS